MGAPRVRSRPGVFSRKAAVRNADGRLIESRIIASIIRELTAQLGGEDRVSAGQRVTIHAAAVLVLRLRCAAERYTTGADPESLDRHIVSLTGALTRTLQALGAIEPSKVPELSLDDYVAAKYPKVAA